MVSTKSVPICSLIPSIYPFSRYDPMHNDGMCSGSAEQLLLAGLARSASRRNRSFAECCDPLRVQLVRLAHGQAK